MPNYHDAKKDIQLYFEETHKSISLSTGIS